MTRRKASAKRARSSMTLIDRIRDVESHRRVTRISPLSFFALSPGKMESASFLMAKGRGGEREEERGQRARRRAERAYIPCGDVTGRV